MRSVQVLELLTRRTLISPRPRGWEPRVIRDPAAPMVTPRPGPSDARDARRRHNDRPPLVVTDGETSRRPRSTSIPAPSAIWNARFRGSRVAMAATGSPPARPHSTWCVAPVAGGRPASDAAGSLEAADLARTEARFRRLPCGPGPDDEIGSP